MFGEIGPTEIKNSIRHPTRVPRYLSAVLRREYRRRRSDTWEEFYIRTTKRAKDPRALVGPVELFDEHRVFQFELLREHGIKPSDRVLELGSGVLRAGLPIIRFVDAGNYAGMDISEKCLLEAHREIHKNDLEVKRPLLIKNDDLSFREVEGFDADYLLSNSVWTHLPPDRVEECIENMGRALADDATILLTVAFAEADVREPETVTGERRGVDWFYPRVWLDDRLEAAGYEMEVLGEVEHPNGQDVLRLTR